MSARTPSVSAVIRLVNAPPTLRIDVVGPDPPPVLLLRPSAGWARSSAGPLLLDDPDSDVPDSDDPDSDVPDSDTPDSDGPMLLTRVLRATSSPAEARRRIPVRPPMFPLGDSDSRRDFARRLPEILNDMIRYQTAAAHN